MARTEMISIYPGNPCHHLDVSGCGIYQQRPEAPCRVYKCAWLTDESIPLWMRPDSSKAIVSLKEVKGIQYREVVECGQKLDSSVLSWIFGKFLTRDYPNIVYQIHSHPRRIGSQEFIDAFEP